MAGMRCHEEFFVKMHLPSECKAESSDFLALSILKVNRVCFEENDRTLRQKIALENPEN